MSLSHRYADRALYVVTLTVTDDVGDSAKVSQIVGAIAPPVTTTIPPAPPAVGAAQYVANQTNPLIPSDLTLFFRLLTSVSPLPDATDAAGLQAVDGDFTYTVTGTFRTPNGTTGTITGRLEGVLEPKPAGDFTGTLTANPPSGLVFGDSQFLRSDHGRFTRVDCGQSGDEHLRDEPPRVYVVEPRPDQCAAGYDDEHDDHYDDNTRDAADIPSDYVAAAEPNHQFGNDGVAWRDRDRDGTVDLPMGTGHIRSYD